MVDISVHINQLVNNRQIINNKQTNTDSLKDLLSQSLAKKLFGPFKIVSVMRKMHNQSMKNESYLEKFLEIWTADGEYELVCVYILAPRGQRDVYQVLAF